MEKGTRLARRCVHRGTVVELYVDRVRLPGGAECELELVEHPGAAAVVPIDELGRVVLVRQYRYATGGWILEVPAGKLDPGESAETCARREVEEEVGLRAERLEPLGFIWTTPGFTDERIWLFRATGLTAAAQTLQHDEVLQVERLPFEEACRMALAGEIPDAKSVCALLRARSAPA